MKNINKKNLIQLFFLLLNIFKFLNFLLILIIKILFLI